MKITEAREILRALAEGVDPFSGEILADEGLWANAKVVRALYFAVERLERQSASTPRSSLPSHAGKPWTVDEDAELRESYGRGAKVHELAQAHGRTTGAITSRLAKLGLLIQPLASDGKLSGDGAEA